MVTAEIAVGLQDGAEIAAQEEFRPWVTSECVEIYQIGNKNAAYIGHDEKDLQATSGKKKHTQFECKQVHCSGQLKY